MGSAAAKEGGPCRRSRWSSRPGRPTMWPRSSYAVLVPVALVVVVAAVELVADVVGHVPAGEPVALPLRAGCGSDEVWVAQMQAFLALPLDTKVRHDGPLPTRPQFTRAAVFELAAEVASAASTDTATVDDLVAAINAATGTSTAGTKATRGRPLRRW